MLNVTTAASAAEFDNAKGSRRKLVKETIFDFNTVVRTNDRLKLAMVSVPEYAAEFHTRRRNPNVREVKRIMRLLQRTAGVTDVTCKYAVTVQGGRTHYVFTY